MLAAPSTLPAWVVVPLAAVAMFLIAYHVLAIQSLPIPASRRRIRTANGFVMLIAAPMFAYAIGIADPADQRRFAIAWTMAIALIVIVMLLAFLDIGNNIRLYSRERAALRRQAREELARSLSALAAAARDGEPGASQGASDGR